MSIFLLHRRVEPNPPVKRSVSLHFIPQGLWPDNYFTAITLKVNTSSSGKTVDSPA